MQDRPASLFAVDLSNSVAMSDLGPVAICCYRIAARSDLVGYLRRKDSSDGAILVQDTQ